MFLRFSFFYIFIILYLLYFLYFLYFPAAWMDVFIYFISLPPTGFGARPSGLGSSRGARPLAWGLQRGAAPGRGGCRGGHCPFSRPQKSLPLCPDFFPISWSWRRGPCGGPSRPGARPLWSPRARRPWSPHGPIYCIFIFLFYMFTFSFQLFYICKISFL